MGISCEINLLKSGDGTFTPGSTVSGTIRYTIDTVTTFERITISFKGNGTLTITEQDKKRNSTYYNSEDYMDIDQVIYNNEKKEPFACGTYEENFSFILPHNIPSSFRFKKHTLRYRTSCKIQYYLRIKFEKPGFLQFDTKFKKDITVVSRQLTPKLSTAPIIFGEQKKLTSLSNLFTNKKNKVNIKATVNSCVILSGGLITLNYEIENDTTLAIQGVETKLVEVYVFTCKGGFDNNTKEDVPDTKFKTLSIKSGDVQNIDVVINAPRDVKSLEHSKIVSRHYAVCIKAVLPVPHRNVVLEIPLQIGDVNMVPVNFDDPPPSYWEAMGEETKENDDDDDTK